MVSKAGTSAEGASRAEDPAAPVPSKLLDRQTRNIWVACTLWPVVVFLEPGLWAVSPALGIAFMLPAIWVYCWLGVLMHEASHNYFPGTDNRVAYNILSLMLFMDPQIFLITHATHHIKVNTWEDRQFNQLGHIKSRPLRVLNNAGEIFLGALYYIVTGTIAVWRDPRLRRNYSPIMGLVWNLTWMIGLALVLTCSALVFHLGVWQTLLPAALGGWACFLVQRHNELAQHAGVIAEGNLAERNMATRNMARAGLASKIFLFLTHYDGATHVLHHTQGAIYTRPFQGRFATPEGSIYITFKDYLKILGRWLRGDEAPTIKAKSAS